MASAVGGTEDYDDFFGTGRIFDVHLQRDVVRAQAFIILVHHRNLDGRAWATALIGKAQVALGLDGFTVMIAKAQGMDHRRSVFDFAFRPDHCSLAIGLDVLRAANRIGEALDHQLAQCGAVGANLRFQVFDETTAQPRVLDHGRQPDHGDRLVGGLAALDKGFFGVRDDLANFKTHERLPE